MALTEHELLHLNAVIRDAEEELEKVGDVVFGDTTDSITTGASLPSPAEVKAQAEAIIASGEFPVGLKPSDIHDYLEKTERVDLSLM